MTGRPPALSLDDVLAAGLAIGLEGLSIAAVAERLGVTRTSVHRYVGSRHDLETLVGEHLVEAAPPTPDVGAPLEEYLAEFARGLAGHVRAHPGLAAYYARGFPRTPRSARVMEDVVGTLVARGLPPLDAARLATAVANYAIASTAHQMLDEHPAADGAGRSAEQAWAGFDPAEFPLLSTAWRAAQEPGPNSESWVDWSLRGVVAGLVALATDPL